MIRDLRLQRTGKTGSPHCLTYLFFLVIILHQNPAHAYFQVQDDTTMGSHANPTDFCKDHSSTESLSVFDTISVPDSGAVVLQFSKCFVPVDIISFNEPMHHTISYIASIDNSLSNYLFANLKLKKLLQEYYMLQKRARELIAELSLTVPGKSIYPFTSKGMENNETVKTDAVYPAKQRLSIQESEITDAMPGIPVHQTPSITALAARQPKTRSTTALSANQPKNVRFIAYASPTPTKHMPGSGVIDEPSYRPPTRSQGELEADLPWFFRLCFRLLNFATTNKAESFCYALVIFPISVFLFSFKRS